MNSGIADFVREFDHSRKHAAVVLGLAHREPGQAVELVDFTNHMNNEFSTEGKTAMLEAVWRRIQIDGRLEEH